MAATQEYDDAVKYLGGVSAGLVLGILLVSTAAAQINAAPPSVTSLGFGGRAINGTPPPSVTSLGPFGYTPGFNPAFPNTRPVFGVNPFQPLNGRHHHHQNGFVPWGWGVGYYAVPYGYYDQSDDTADAQADDQYDGGPTVFDRRGSGRVPRPPDMATTESASAAPEPAVASPPETTVAPEQPQTVLVFKDGHQIEVENYAIVGSTLYDLSNGGRRKIPLSDLDLDATTKQNDQRGIDFQVPSGS